MHKLPLNKIRQTVHGLFNEFILQNVSVFLLTLGRDGVGGGGDMKGVRVGPSEKKKQGNDLFNEWNFQVCMLLLH